MKILTRLFFVPLLICALASSCQSKEEGSRQRLLPEHISSVQDAGRYLADSIGENFGNYLADLLYRFPESIDYSFPVLSDSTDLTINTSPDGMIRLYSWDGHMGGTMIDYNTIIQWRDERGNIHFDTCTYPEDDKEEDGTDITLSHLTYDDDETDLLAPMTINSITQLPIPHNGRTVYIIQAYMREWSTMGAYCVMAVSIIDGRPQAIPYFNNGTRNGNECAISYEVNIPGWYFASKGEGWEWLNSYDPATRTLYIPVMGDDEMPTDRYYLYRPTPNGSEMKCMGIGAGPWLHPSLEQFEELYGIYTTENGILFRIDRLHNNAGYRYAAWNRDTVMSAEPVIVAYARTPGKDDPFINFENNGYTYQLPRPSHSEEYPREMRIYHGGEMIKTLKYQ